MPRNSAWTGNHVNNSRPFVTISPDVYVAIQGQTFVIGCGECNKQVNFNEYLTSVSVDAAVDSPPGTATLNLTIPDTDSTEFYAENNLIIIPMMEIEIYAKGYFLVGGIPQYYKIFWGLISSVSKSWSDGVTTVSINCRDILRWWELTQIKLNPSFLDGQGSSAGGYVLFQNQFAGANPYSVILELAKESMGDWSQSVSSFTSFNPEQGQEANTSNNYLDGIMVYWQTKFKQIWNNLVMYGASGKQYTSFGDGSTVSAVDLSNAIFKREWEYKKDESQANALLKLSPAEIAAYKVEIPRAGDVSFFEPESRTKLTIAMEARDQIGYEFYCDTTGDIVFKPPFYNLNVLPNKPVSWIQDIDILDDSIQEQEAEVFTHIVASGNAFGGVTDYGINDEFTTPRTGAYDFHLLKRYGWRKYDYQCEWAGNPRKLFFHILDYLDRLNAKRTSGTVTIPLRPEIRMGFPIWFPKYDSFFYVQGIGHNYSVGGDATTTLTLIARRSKFMAPRNLGKISFGNPPFKEVKLEYKYVDPKSGAVTAADKKKNPPPPPQYAKIPNYVIDFPDTSTTDGNNKNTAPLILRHPKTGRMLGYPRVVMVFKRSINGEVLAKNMSNGPVKQETQKGKPAPKGGKPATTPKGPPFERARELAFLEQLESQKEQLLSRIRKNRYEAGASNAGEYDYAEDTTRTIKEFLIISVDNMKWGNKDGGGESTIQGITNQPPSAKDQKEYEASKKAKQEEVKKAQASVNSQNAAVTKRKQEGQSLASQLTMLAQTQEDRDRILNENADIRYINDDITGLEEGLANLTENLNRLKKELLILTASRSKYVPSPSVMIRPVSDEFGFEVIGHYRYGRGSFIDRGKLKIADEKGNKANEINIQFSPTAGLLTESVTIDPGGPLDFASAFEKMRPDDWATGATFTWNKTDDVSSVAVTDVTTYTNDIEMNIGKSVFIEVDSTRKSRLLSELKPTIEINGLSDPEANCACGIGKTDWLGILPLSVISEILKAPGSASIQIASREDIVGLQEIRDINANPMAAIAAIASDPVYPQSIISLVKGSVNSGSFFTELNKYLRTNFDTALKENKARELEYSGENLKKTNPFDRDYGLTDNSYSPPGGALFDRAAQGDSQAIEALKNQANFDFNQANFNFNQLNTSAKQFQDAYLKGKEKINQTLGELKENSKAIFSEGALKSTFGAEASSSPPEQVQPPTAPPEFSQVINPGKYGQSYISTNPVDPTKIAPNS